MDWAETEIEIQTETEVNLESRLVTPTCRNWNAICFSADQLLSVLQVDLTWLVLTPTLSYAIVFLMASYKRPQCSVYAELLRLVPELRYLSAVVLWAIIACIYCRSCCSRWWWCLLCSLLPISKHLFNLELICCRFGCCYCCFLYLWFWY